MTLRIVVMGVTGCGKSRIGSGLAAGLCIRWFDGDDLHPPANVEKMRAGIPLTDADRLPWLDRVAEVLRYQAPVAVGCSALRRIYRDRLRQGAGAPVRFVHLAGDPALLAERLARREGHFMPPALLASQLATLEPPGPEEALIVDIATPADALIAQLVQALQEEQG